MQNNSLDTLLQYFTWIVLSKLIEEEAIDLMKKFPSPRRSTLEDGDGSQLEDIDIIPNDEMLLVYNSLNCLCIQPN